jgi:hypothetical protein
MFCPMEMLLGEKVTAIVFPELFYKLFVCLHSSQRRGKILKGCRERTLPAAMGGTEEDIKICPWTFGQIFIRPGIGRAAAMKVDVRSNNCLWGVAPVTLIRLPGPFGRLEMAFELALQFLGIFFINRSCMGRRAHGQTAKLLYDSFLVFEKSFAVKILVGIKKIDKLF